MLDAPVKEQIQSAYRQLLESRELIPRYGQRLMIAEIAKTLAQLDPECEGNAPVCVIEAGTGTGKTLAYVLAALPFARAKNLKVIISTATVALQEQIVFKDLPDILAGCDLQFDISLAKGRGRYICLSKLDNLLAGNDSLEAMLDLYGIEAKELENAAGKADDEQADRQLYEDMLNELSAGKWDGDRDNWDKPLRDVDWKAVTVNEGQCMGAKCSNFRSCYFYKARESMDKADCIVTNHDLVLADLALGGGAILPAPEKCVFIFDEAHHLPLKSNNHFSNSSRINGTSNWLESLKPMLSALAKEKFAEPGQAVQLEKAVAMAKEGLEEASLLCDQIMSTSESAERYENRQQYAFPAGVVPDELVDLASRQSLHFNQLHHGLEDIVEKLREGLEDEDLQVRQGAEQWFSIVGGSSRRAETNLNLWLSYARPDEKSQVPMARWLSFTSTVNFEDTFISSSPVLAAENLQQHLWQRCAAAVLTSATLSALGNFDMLRMRAGLPEETRYFAIPSPFNYAEAAKFVVPKMHCEPSASERHTDAILNALPQILDKKEAALMLFSSRRQMLDVLQNLPTPWRDLVLCQDDYQKAQLLKYHRHRVDEGLGSIIFGLSSFAEGVDLPGKYCTHVLVAKIPFAVPNDPIELTLSEWVESQGRNAFMTLAVPDAAFRLVQACGRLLRSETDTGRITLFDERIVSKRYGKSILDSLPPYTREIFAEEYRL